MDKRFREIYDNTIPHSTFLSESSIMMCLHQSHQLGVDDVFEWLEMKGYLTDDIRLIRKEWIEEKVKIK